jgi:hypothetical protein
MKRREFSAAGMSVVPSLQKVAAATGLQMEGFVADGTNAGIEAAFSKLMEIRIDAVIASPGPRFYALRTQVAAVAARHSIL